MDKRIVITETQAAALRELGMGELVVMCPTVSETLHTNLNRAASALVAPAPAPAPVQAELPNMPTAKPDTRRKNPGAPPNGRSRPVKEVMFYTRYAAGVKKLRSNTLVEMAGVALMPIAETYKGEPVAYSTVLVQLGKTGFTNSQAITAVRELEKKKLLTRCY
jgi:hypothetical protein